MNFSNRKQIDQLSSVYYEIFQSRWVERLVYETLCSPHLPSTHGQSYFFYPTTPTNWIFKKQNQTIKPFHPKKFHCVAWKDKGSKKMQHCCYTLKIYNSLVFKYLVSIQPSWFSLFNFFYCFVLFESVSKWDWLLAKWILNFCLHYTIFWEAEGWHDMVAESYLLNLAFMA